ncbi:hypothetical protein KL933_002390 [Ogataea haglerorum]|uniref:U3 small nucleolar RNA-associated protein 6 N-terminal domain-containing protein n=1 Tax=Ogataea haglerorum TaxID=1937702 RepID=A0AAN6I0S3_9ASCO|nr:hypothetical protein KL933_002390 [Ogataea haglerorum]
MSKSRYFLEQSVPELKDLERKKLFTRKEITMIMRRRTDFEQRIAGRGSKPMDFLAYAQYEKTLEKLRRKRYNRMKPVIDTKPSVSDWASTRRIFFIFERGVNKFPKSMDLWSSYLKFARKNGSVKVVYSIYSKLLQLQPKNINVWFSAASYEFEQNRNVKSARNLFKRCVRFNPESSEVWQEFIKLELTYLSKLLLRRKLLKIITEQQQIQDLKENEAGNFEGDDMISLIPDTEINDELNKLPEMNIDVLGTAETNPVLKGDLVLAIFDVAVHAIQKNVQLSEDKFAKVWDFCSRVLALIDNYDILDRLYLANHVVEWLVHDHGHVPKVLLLRLTLPLRYVELDDAEFVSTLQSSVKTYQSWATRAKVEQAVKDEVKHLYTDFITQQYLSKADGEVKQILTQLVKKLK